MIEDALQYAHVNKNKFIEDLRDFIRIKSISTDPHHAPDMEKAANWLTEILMKSVCQNSRVYKTSGHPIVFGEYRSNRSHARTILIYGHYDVQPIDPIKLWESNPFEPEIVGDRLFARGASDMKGQVIASIKAVESILSQKEEIPLNLKFIIEGEEEIGSPSLPEFLESHKELLQCDIVLNPDAGMLSVSTPAITYGLRGLAYFELRITGSKQDLHSGQYGGIIHNPAQVLCEVIAKMHDNQGKVTLPGFYENVRPASPGRFPICRRQLGCAGACQ